MHTDTKYIFPYKRVFMKHLYNKIVAEDHYLTLETHQTYKKKKCVKVICNDDDSLQGYMIYSRLKYDSDIIIHSIISWYPDKGYVEITDNITSPEIVIGYYKDVICGELIFPIHEWWYIMMHNCDTYNNILVHASKTRDILSYEEYLIEYPLKLLNNIEVYLANGLTSLTSLPHSHVLSALIFDNNKIRIDTKCRYLLDYLDKELNYSILHYILRMACHLNLQGLLKQTLIKVRDVYGNDFKVSSDVIDILKHNNNIICLSILRHYTNFVL